MTYNEFIKEMEQRVQTKLGDKYSVKLVEQQKNNNSIWHGLLIRKDGDDIAPIIYLKDFFESAPVPDAADEIIKCYHSLEKPKILSVSTDLREFSTIKEKILCKVINYEKNQEMLRSIPFTKFKDLAIVFFVLIGSNTNGQLTVQIQNEHLKLWNVTKQEIEKIAKENTRVIYPMIFKGIGEVILSMMGSLSEEKPINEDEVMFVVTNETKTYGAVNIIFEDILENIAQKLEDNYYILPSSIHDLIILPEGSGCMKEEMEAIVADINATQVEEEDVLSNTVYFYDRIEKKLL